MIHTNWSMGSIGASDAFDIRSNVFIQEYRVSPETEFDEIDHISAHLVLYDGHMPVATGRLHLKGNGVYCIDKVAVLHEFRGKYYGDMLFRMLLDRAIRMGAESVEMTVPSKASGFFMRFGLKITGDFKSEYVPLSARCNELVFPRKCEM